MTEANSRLLSEANAAYLNVLLKPADFLNKSHIYWIRAEHRDGGETTG